jgi:peptide/nickel transport system permease protein
VKAVFGIWFSVFDIRYSVSRSQNRIRNLRVCFLLAALFAGGTAEALAQPERTAQSASVPNSEYVLASQKKAKALVWSAAGPSLLISAAAAAVTYGLAIATAFSILFFGTWTKRLLRQALELIACLSPMVLLLVAYAARQHLGHFFFALLALAIFPLVGRPLLARVSEASRSFHFTEATVLGHSSLGVFRHYAWPRFLPLTLPYFFLGFIQSLLVESMFSSLGLIRFSSNETWGSLIHKGLEDILDEPWLVFYAGAAIMATTLCAYLCVPLLDRLLSVERKA